MGAIASASDLSAVGILAIVAVMYFFGLIVPRRVYKDMERQRDKYEVAYTELRNRYDKQFDSRIEANTEALRLVQKSFESIAEVDTKTS